MSFWAQELIFPDGAVGAMCPKFAKMINVQFSPPNYGLYKIEWSSDYWSNEKNSN